MVLRRRATCEDHKIGQSDRIQLYYEIKHEVIKSKMRMNSRKIGGEIPHRGWNSMDRTFVSYPKWHEAGVRITAFNVTCLIGSPEGGRLRARRQKIIHINKLGSK
jgi:hypothetical protein